jgi:hypothetical protein
MPNTNKMQVKYMQAADTPWATKDDLLKEMAHSLLLSDKDFAELFLIEEYSPVQAESGFSLYTNSLEVKLTQHFRIRMKTPEEIDIERTNRSNGIVTKAYPPRYDRLGRIESWDWAADVAAMSDKQIYKVYMRLIRAGKITGI